MIRRRFRMSPFAVGIVAATASFAAPHRAGAEVLVDLAQLEATHSGFHVAFDGEAGRSVSGAGDIDGDGRADVLVGAPDTSSGGAYLVSWASEGTVALLSHIVGVAPIDLCGDAVSGAGDTNGDGMADLLVGAWGADPSGKLGAGESYLLFGEPASGTVRLAELGTGGIRIEGNAGESSGRSVSGAGDVNGDGMDDFIVGAPYFNRSGLDGVGRSYVVFGTAQGPTLDLANLGDGGFVIRGLAAGGQAGISVSGAGDVNGDGLADLIVGARRVQVGEMENVGAGYVVFGKTDSSPVDLDSLGDGGFAIMGNRAFQFLGASVSAAGDVNGDGLADVVVGAYGMRGATKLAGNGFVVFGKADALPVDVAALGSTGFRIDGLAAVDDSPARVAGAGDVNGDGFADLIVGAPYANPGGELFNGDCRVVYGKANGATIDLAVPGTGGMRFRGIGTYDFLGSSVSAAGDVDGDGLADVVAGAYGRSESYVIFSPAIPPPSAIYRSTAPAGNAPRVAIGIVGDGSDDDSPSSRCWIDFDGGRGPGLAGSSMQTVTLVRNDAGIRALKPERLANVQWRVQTDRTGWKKTRVTLKYTDAEIAGLDENTLRVWRASSPRGPWALYSSGMQREPQRNCISVNVPVLGYFAIEGEPAP